MRTAVFLRGHARTWNLIKNHTLALFNDIYDMPDWYVLFADTSTVSRTSVIADLASSRAIFVETIPEQSIPVRMDQTEDLHSWQLWHSAYWRLAWYDYLLGRQKRTWESQQSFLYDSVVFLRPDIWYMDADRHGCQLTLPPMDMCEAGAGHDTSMLDWYTGDLIWRAGSAAADLLTMRALDTHHDPTRNQLLHGNSHTLLATYQVRNFIGHRLRSGFASQLIRPDMAEQLPWDLNKHDQHYNDSRVWFTLDAPTRAQLCLDLEIDPLDYQLLVDH